MASPTHTLPENLVRKQEDRVGRNVSNNTEFVTDQRCQVYNGHVPSYLDNVTSVQLKRAGIGQNASCTMGDFG